MSVAGTHATAALLWAACRPEPDLDAVRAAVADGADLPLAADTAQMQRASGLLRRALDAAGVELPGEDDWVRELELDVARCRAQAMLLFPRFAQAALVPLAEAGFEPLLVKGGALAERYPAPGLRPMDDIDIVLPAEQHQPAVRALTAAGWRLARGPGPSDHSSGLVHPELPGLPLEFHLSLGTWRDRGSGPSSELLWQRRRPITFSDAPAFGLDVEDELAMLVAHAGKPHHCFSRIVWMTDLVVVVGDGPVDWERVAHDAERDGYRTVLAIALTQSHRLGLESPPALRAVTARGMRARALAPLLDDDWPLTGKAGREELLRYVLVDRYRRRVGLFVGNATRTGLRAAPASMAASARRALGRWQRMRRSDDS
jgi:hypothetical protein